jgi:hypothetical protein
VAVDREREPPRTSLVPPAQAQVEVVARSPNIVPGSRGSDGSMMLQGLQPAAAVSVSSTIDRFDGRDLCRGLMT